LTSTDNKTYVTYNSPSAPTIGQKLSPYAVLPNAWQQDAWTQDSGTLDIQELEHRIRDLEEKCRFQEEFIKKVNSLYELLVNED